MAKIAFKAGDDFALRLSRLATGSDAIAKKAIYEGAKIVTDEIKRRLEENINSPESVSKSGKSLFKGTSYEQTGDLSDSLGITEIKRDSSGNWNAKVGFDGYDQKGVPNQLKARAMESGTSVLRKRPFVRPAVNATRAVATEKMNEIIKKETDKILGGT